LTIERIDNELCTGCSICADICPMDVIRMDENGETAIIKYKSDCMACNVCSLDCPTQAITISPHKDNPPILCWG
jgi:adenylylsulfate reductase subunit B